MYKIVNIVDLKIASKFIESDKIIELSNDRSTMYIGENDYSHKNQTYLSTAINIVDNTLNSYLNAIDEINSTYITTDITNIYLPANSLIKNETFDLLMDSDAFLTKEGCKKIETDCLNYLNELKNKAMSTIIAQLNVSFIKQNSAGRIAYGQVAGDDAHIIDYNKQIATEPIPENGSYNFDTGEFSLAYLLYGTSDFSNIGNYSGEFNQYTDPSSPDDPSVVTIDALGGTDIGYDFWKENYYEPNRSFFSEDDIMDFSEITSLIDLEKWFAFNASVFPSISELSSNPDFRIHVPFASYDFKWNKSIPIAKLVEFFLKMQIKQVIKRICDVYISKMTSIPQFIYQQ